MIEPYTPRIGFEYVRLPEPTRIAQQRVLPAAAKPRATALGFESGIQVASASVTNGQSITNEVSVLDKGGYLIHCLVQRATFVGTANTDNLLPQREGGANVGPAESSYLIRGPYDALIPSDSTATIASNEWLNQLYIRNNSGSTQTIIFWINVRIVRINPPNPGTATT